MDAEQKLAQIVFSSDPIDELIRTASADFATTDRRQLIRFHARLLRRLEERLSAQFGGCLGLVEEKTGIMQSQIAAEFATSPEYRLVREDLCEADIDSEARFEMAFLNFVLRSQSHLTAFIEEFGNVYMAELALI